MSEEPQSEAGGQEAEDTVQQGNSDQPSAVEPPEIVYHGGPSAVEPSETLPLTDKPHGNVKTGKEER